MQKEVKLIETNISAITDNQKSDKSKIRVLEDQIQQCLDMADKLDIKFKKLGMRDLRKEVAAKAEQVDMDRLDHFS